MKVDVWSKAISAALAAGLLVFDMACEVKSDAGTAVSVAEWIRTAVSAAIAGLAVYSVPNAPDEK